jgi:exopolyphosphatase/guanosine-5'-triphosphate,3'-diphosphate pyrophosphatase
MAAKKTPSRIAAVDLGSLTVRLAVGAGDGSGGVRVLRQRREVTGLGEGLAQTGYLSSAAMARTLKALEGFVREMQDYGVSRAQAVATQALRQAKNRQVFLEQLQELGLTVRLLSPEEEARLTLQGVLSALRPEFLQVPVLVVFDVGGGSSEFTLIRSGQEPKFAGLPLGVLTLSQAHPLGDPPRPEAVAALKQKLTGQLSHFFQAHFQEHLPESPRLVGTAGAVTTLAAMSIKMSDYDPNRVNNMTITRAQVAELADLMARLPEAERARLPGMEAAKAGVMIAGALMVLTILEAFHQDRLVVIDAGLLEGVLGEMASLGEGG